MMHASFGSDCNKDHQVGYPEAICVKNTFIDVLKTRPASLDEFFEERTVRSCPASPVCSGHSSRDGDGSLILKRSDTDIVSDCSTTDTDSIKSSSVGAKKSTAAGMLPRAKTWGVSMFTRLEQQSAAAISSIASSVVGSNGGVPDPQAAAAAGGDGEASTSKSTMKPPPAVLNLHDALQMTTPSVQPPLDPAMYPSAGSLGHYTGECRPCAFINTKGCGSGKSCTFCHLCEPGEKKRRQKAKKQFFKIIRHEFVHQTTSLGNRMFTNFGGGGRSSSSSGSS